MSRKKNSFTRFASQLMKQLHDLHLTREIQERRRFIEKNHGSLLRQRFSDHPLLTLPVTQRVDHTIGQILYLHESD